MALERLEKRIARNKKYLEPCARLRRSGYMVFSDSLLAKLNFKKGTRFDFYFDRELKKIVVVNIRDGKQCVLMANDELYINANAVLQAIGLSLPTRSTVIPHSFATLTLTNGKFNSVVFDCSGLEQSIKHQEK